MVPFRRHARNRLTYLACGGLVLGAVLTSNFALAGERHAPDTKTPIQKPTCEPHQPLCTAAVAGPASYTYPYSCEKPENLEQDNLCVARRAANAAQRQADWSKKTFWLSVVGAIAIFVTVGFTIVAARAAQRSADNAVFQTKLIRAEYTSTHRPRVILREAIVEALVPGSSVMVIMVLANIGETPASIIYSQVGVEAVEEGDQRLLTNTLADNPDEEEPLLRRRSVETSNDIGQFTIEAGGQRTISLGTGNTTLIWDPDVFGERFQPVFAGEAMVIKVVSPISSVHLFGQFGYTDEAGVVRRTAFRRYLRSSRQRFYRLPNNYEPDLDYTD